MSQRVIHLLASNKLRVLVDLLNTMPRSIIFTRTKRGADRLVKGLSAAAIQALAIHGNKSQAQRERALGKFRNGQANILVATDIAARGIDIDEVSHIVNYDLPEVPESCASHRPHGPGRSQRHRHFILRTRAAAAAQGDRAADQNRDRAAGSWAGHAALAS